MREMLLSTSRQCVVGLHLYGIDHCFPLPLNDYGQKHFLPSVLSELGKSCDDMVGIH